MEKKMSNENDKIKIGKDCVDLDIGKLSFNEQTLSQYLQTEGGYYDNYGSFLARAEYILQRREIAYEVTYAETFKDFKEQGGSDKLAEAKTDSDPEVIKAKEEVAKAKFKVRRLQQHLRSWDKNHENAQSLGHTLRKEMDKLNFDIRQRGFGNDNFNYSQIEEVVKPFEPSSEGTNA
jgi:hypothetical protein